MIDRVHPPVQQELSQLTSPMRNKQEISWTTTWTNCCCYTPVLQCNRCGVKNHQTGVYFEVLIDFGNTRDDDNSSVMRPGQKNVLQHMEKLLFDHADVATSPSSSLMV